jgi:rare lipoprotein A
MTGCAISLIAYLAFGCAAKLPTVRATMFGIASYYHEDDFVALGASYNPWEITAASRALPLGSVARVTNLRNGRSIIVRINDRGPAAWTRRIIDLSLYSAVILRMVHSGTVPVRVDVLHNFNDGGME